EGSDGRRVPRNSFYVSGASAGGAPAPRRPAARTAPDGVVIVPSGPSPPKFRGRPPTRGNGRHVRGKAPPGGTVTLEGGLSLETRDQIVGLAVELGPLAGGDGLAGDELLAERIAERAVPRHAVVEVGPGGEPGGADGADDLLLPYAHARMEPRSDPREVVVLGLVPGPMPQVHLDAVAAVPAGVHDHAVGDGADRRTDGRPVVDREVGPDAAQDRMRARVREAGRDARELERRPEEALAQRLAGRVVVPVARRALEPDAGQYPAAARVLGHQDPAVVDEGVTGVALLDQQAEAVAGARVGGEVEVRGEHVDQLQHQPRRLARAFDRVEERTLHHTAHGFDPQVGHRFRAADPPGPVHRPGGVREPRARLVPDLDRLLPEVPHDPDGRAGTKLPQVGA